MMLGLYFEKPLRESFLLTSRSESLGVGVAARNPERLPLRGLFAREHRRVEVCPLHLSDDPMHGPVADRGQRGEFAPTALQERGAAIPRQWMRRREDGGQLFVGQSKRACWRWTWREASSYDRAFARLLNLRPCRAPAGAFSFSGPSYQ